MQNLLQFLWKNHFTLLFAVLEVFAFSLLVSTNNFHNTKFHQFGVAVSGRIFEVQHAYTQYLGLTDENKKLRDINAKLLSYQINRNIVTTERQLGFEVIPTNAINSTYHLDNNFVIIDAGKLDGIEPAMAVMSPNGAVGIVRTVSDHYASIIPIIHSNSDISARLKSSNYFGQCTWHGFNETQATLENIPNHVNINAGDTIVTRGAGGIFPADIIIGFALETEKNESSGFQKITIELAADFRNLRSLYVIKNNHQSELDSLTTETKAWTDN